MPIPDDIRAYLDSLPEEEEQDIWRVASKNRIYTLGNKIAYALFILLLVAICLVSLYLFKFFVSPNARSFLSAVPLAFVSYLVLLYLKFETRLWLQDKVVRQELVRRRGGLC